MFVVVPTPPPVSLEGLEGPHCRLRSAFEIPFFDFLWRLGGVGSNPQLPTAGKCGSVAKNNRGGSYRHGLPIPTVTCGGQLEAVRLQYAASRQATSGPAFYQTMRLCAVGFTMHESWRKVQMGPATSER